VEDLADEPKEDYAVVIVADGNPEVLDREDEATWMLECEFCGCLPCGCGG
jgi:hypothetical protein